MDYVLVDFLFPAKNVVSNLQQKEEARGTPEYRYTALKNRKYRNTVSKIVNTALQFTKRDCNLLFILLHIYTELPSSKLFFSRNTVCLNAKSRITSGLRIP